MNHKAHKKIGYMKGIMLNDMVPFLFEDIGNGSNEMVLNSMKKRR